MNTAPFLPVTRPEIDEQTIRGVADVLRSDRITTGPMAQQFEATLTEFFGGRPVRAYNSAAATVETALRMLGIGEGHEVITTPLSWVATANIVLTVGARPVFVDIDPVTRNIDPARIEAAITPRTRALLPVHVAGLPCDLDALYRTAQQHGLRVIEGATQAIGSTWHGKRVGSFGDYASFSFHQDMNATSIEGGCLVLPADADVALAEQLRLQGVVRSGLDGMEVDVVGGKSNLTDVAARVGLGQMKRLDEFNARRRVLARRYFELFDQAGAAARGIELPLRDDTGSNWHMFQVVLPPHVTRATFMQSMKDRGIGTGVHYPAIHLFALYRRLGWQEGDFPQAERICRSIVSLPLFPAMTQADVERVVGAVDSIAGAWQ